MTDVQDVVLDLAIKLEKKAAHGHTLTADEQIFADLAWIDTMVGPDGFEGWLHATAGERILATPLALDTIGADELKQQLLDALAAIGIDATASDDVLQELLDSMSDAARAKLHRLDDIFLAGLEGYMIDCYAFAEERGLLGTAENSLRMDT